MSPQEDRDAALSRVGVSHQFITFLQFIFSAEGGQMDTRIQEA